AAVGGPRDHDLAVLLLHVDLAALALGELALRALHAHQLRRDGDLDAVRDRHRLLSDAAHYQTLATSSPPTPARRASWPVMTPWDVDTIVVPMPPRTFGMVPASTYWRRRGFDTRWRPWMTGLRSSVYFSVTRSTRPTRA